MKLLGYLIPPWAWAAMAAVALTAAFSAGWQVQEWRCAAAQTKALKQAQADFQKQLDKQNKEAAEYEQSRERTRVEYRDREGAIRTVYETVEVPAACAAPDAVRGLLDNAVQSANGATGQPGGTVPSAR